MATPPASQSAPGSSQLFVGLNFAGPGALPQLTRFSEILMATASSARTRRRPLRAVAHRNVSQPSYSASLMRLATSRPARAAYVILGTAGLAALAVAIVGPKRLEREVLRPLRSAIEPQAEKLWADSKPLRDQIAGLFESATPSGRARLAKSFQSWIGHFHAT